MIERGTSIKAIEQQKNFVLDNAHIPEKEVLQDIADTEREITELRAGEVAVHPRLIDGAITDRQEFIDDLKFLLELRKNPSLFS